VVINGIWERRISGRLVGNTEFGQKAHFSFPQHFPNALLGSSAH
jgi:hypothetical protein